MKKVIMSWLGCQKVSIAIMKTNGIAFLESDLYWEAYKS